MPDRLINLTETRADLEGIIWLVIILGSIAARIIKASKGTGRRKPVSTIRPDPPTPPKPRERQSAWTAPAAPAPVAVAKAASRAAERAEGWLPLLKNRDGLRDAVVLREILGPPVALRRV